ncbi:MAG: hypothetical protein Q7U02_09660 [Desulfosalsimonadaceae bacterium]|nr:hypothetical protein [Desulfosalsimonadaceae bacterium]
MFDIMRQVSEKSFRKGHVRGAVLFVLAFGCLLVLMSCGRKALPTPVSAVAPPVVTGLKAQIDDNHVKLTWSVPDLKGEEDDRLAGFRVYRSLEDLSDPICEDCPRPFQKAAELNIGKTASGEGAVYAEPVKKGFRYFYRISCYTEDGAEGEKSETVTITP